MSTCSAHFSADTRPCLSLLCRRRPGPGSGLGRRAQAACVLRLVGTTTMFIKDLQSKRAWALCRGEKFPTRCANGKLMS